MKRALLLRLGSVWSAIFAAAAVAGCGGGEKPASTAPGGSTSEAHWPADDQSLCNRFVHWRGNPALATTETAGPGAIKPNIRRVYKAVGDRDDRHSLLVCREIDTNLDGVKDVVRTFNDKGEPLHEEADTNYDGRIDVWINFADGRIAEEDTDTTLSSGRPNVWKFYVNGELSRIRRNTHCASGRPDTWEIYYHDRIERVGNDLTCDGHVDRWDRDQQILEAEEAAQERAASDAGAASGSAPMTVGAGGEILDGGVPPSSTSSKRKAR
jgi:hypothetical protein